MEILLDNEQNRFYTYVDGYYAYAGFDLYDNCLDVKTTRVPKEIGGRGIAGALVKACYDYAQEQKLNCVATCSYAYTYLQRHPEYKGTKSKFYVEGSCAI